MNSYILIKNNDTKEIIYIDYEKIDGFKFKPQNKISHEGIVVNKMILIKPSLIDKVLKRKVKRKLDAYLNFLIHIIDSDDDDDTTIRFALDEVSRYRQTIINTYRKYLEDKYVNILLKKIALLESELKNRLAYTKQDVEVKGKSR